MQGTRNIRVHFVRDTAHESCGSGPVYSCNPGKHEMGFLGGLGTLFGSPCHGISFSFRVPLGLRILRDCMNSPQLVTLKFTVSYPNHHFVCPEYETMYRNCK